MKRKATVLLTGGAGYIGSHCAKLLVKAGYDVVVYDSLVRGYSEALLYGDFVQGDLADVKTLDRVLTGRTIDAVLHFAAFINVGESVHKPDLYMDNNFGKTRTFLDALMARGVRRFIFSSTCAVYGMPQKLPLTEDHPRAPINPYGESKYRVELSLEELEKRGLKSIKFRYFNAAGADPDGELGERHDPETHLIPVAIRAALGSGKPLQVFGTDYETADGTAVRDYIHVNDLCKAHILGLEYLLEGGESNVFNLGNGNGFTVREVIRSVERALGKTVPASDHPRREGDATVLVGDASKVRGVLNWTPSMPDLDDIVRTACRFEKEKSPVRKQG